MHSAAAKDANVGGGVGGNNGSKPGIRKPFEPELPADIEKEPAEKPLASLSIDHPAPFQPSPHESNISSEQSAAPDGTATVFVTGAPPDSAMLLPRLLSQVRVQLISLGYDPPVTEMVYAVVGGSGGGGAGGGGAGGTGERSAALEHDPAS